MPSGGKRGQSTVEYLLLVLLAAIVACAVLALVDGGFRSWFGIVRQTIMTWLSYM